MTKKEGVILRILIRCAPGKGLPEFSLPHPAIAERLAGKGLVDVIRCAGYPPIYVATDYARKIMTV